MYPYFFKESIRMKTESLEKDLFKVGLGFKELLPAFTRQALENMVFSKAKCPLTNVLIILQFIFIVSFLKSSFRQLHYEFRYNSSLLDF